jgi:uncharacterized protein
MFGGNKNTKLSISSTAGEILDRVNKAISKDKEPSQDDEEVLELTQEVEENIENSPAVDQEIEKAESLETQEIISQEALQEPEVIKEPKKRTASTHEKKKKIKATQKGSVKNMAKKLVSTGTAETTSALFNKLKESAKTKKASNSLRFESGNTVEDLIAELIKPQLSEWLDEHLSNIVKEVVEKEVKKLLPSDD